MRSRLSSAVSSHHSSPQSGNRTIGSHNRLVKEDSTNATSSQRPSQSDNLSIRRNAIQSVFTRLLSPFVSTVRQSGNRISNSASHSLTKTPSKTQPHAQRGHVFAHTNYSSQRNVHIPLTPGLCNSHSTNAHFLQQHQFLPESSLPSAYSSCKMLTRAGSAKVVRNNSFFLDRLGKSASGAAAPTTVSAPQPPATATIFDVPSKGSER